MLVNPVRGKVCQRGGQEYCTECATNHYQPKTGQIDCLDCTKEFDEYKTNNADHSNCVVNTALISDSLVEIMISGGGALYSAFLVSATFTMICSLMQYFREQAPDEDLGRLQRYTIILKSTLPGFSFGSEMFTIAIMLTTEPLTGILMILFRIPPLEFNFILLAMFADVSWTERVILGANAWRKMLNVDWAKKNIPLVGAVTLLSFCDVTIADAAMEGYELYEQSKGFPNKPMMQLCLGVETLNFASMICLVLYLCAYNDINDPFMSWKAKLLFGLNIFFSALIR